MTFVALAASVILSTASPIEAGDDISLFALVVAHNDSLDPAVKALRFADDDGARFFELVSAAGAETELLAVLDAQTQSTFPDLAAIARVPSRAELTAAMDRLNNKIEAANNAGRHTVFYFYYAGHGDVGEDREGFLNLVDARFVRSDLYREVIGRSKAEINHIIIDACNSYFVVNRGGKTPSRAVEALDSFLSTESLARYPSTGVVLSTATETESHEWSRYRSGIFSHQLLSALWGAADIDQDFNVAYDELTAYIAAANMGVRDERARLAIFARPPRSDEKSPLFDLALLQTRGTEHDSGHPQVGGSLTVPEHMTGHYYLEDDRGVRFAEFHKSDEQPLRVVLLDRPYYYLRAAESEAMIRLADNREVDAGRLQFSEIELDVRGSLEMSFAQDLYSYPFGVRFLAGHREATRASRLTPDLTREPLQHRADLGPWKWTAFGVGAATLVAGTTLQVLAYRASKELNDKSGLTMKEAVAIQRRQIDLQTAAFANFGVALSAAAAAVILFVADADPEEAPLSLQGGAGPQGVWLRAVATF